MRAAVAAIQNRFLMIISPRFGVATARLPRCLVALCASVRRELVHMLPKNSGWNSHPRGDGAVDQPRPASAGRSDAWLSCAGPGKCDPDWPNAQPAFRA